MSIEQIIEQSSLDCISNNLKQIGSEYRLIPEISDLCAEIEGQIQILKDRLKRINAYDDYR